ncbi:MAG: DUF177 domain-containing protein [Myxococcota bacterium]|nr:DUF177 domain-containing protein [Myxococcota bacterium]
MDSPEFAFPARELDASGKRFSVALRASWICRALEGTEVRPGGKDGELDVRLSKSGTDVVVHGSLTAELHVPCARCLQPARVVISERVSALAVPVSVLAEKSSGDEGDRAELGAGQADVLSYDGDTVVLDDLVRDELLLGIPMIPLCSEGCPGIRPKTAPDSASASGLGPRFRPLMRLKKS